MNPRNYLRASDGNGPAVLAHVSTDRAALDTTLEVDSVDNWPTKGIAASGTLLPSGFIDEGDLTEFRFHLSGGDIVIDEICPGFTDNGNTDDQVVVVKQTTDWADIIADAIQQAIPAGIIQPYGGPTAPDGWLLCYGQAIDRDDYADLFDAIGTTWGSGDGVTTFNVPDLRGRVLAGQDDMGGSSANRLTGLTGGVNGDTLGAYGGEEAHALLEAELAAHRHFVVWNGTVGTAALSNTNQVASTRNAGSAFDYAMDNGGTSNDANAGRSSSTGSGTAHNNVQPTAIVNYMIKT